MNNKRTYIYRGKKEIGKGLNKKNNKGKELKYKRLIIPRKLHDANY